MRRLLPSPAELSCQQVVELVSDYLEGKLSRRDRRRFEKHIKACDGCSAYLEQMRQTIRMLGRLEEHHLTAKARRELIAAFRDWST